MGLLLISSLLAFIENVNKGGNAHRQLLSQVPNETLDQRNVVVDTLVLHAKGCIPEGVDQPKCFRPSPLV